jgi:hypothetical protein
MVSNAFPGIHATGVYGARLSGKREIHNSTGARVGASSQKAVRLTGKEALQKSKGDRAIIIGNEASELMIPWYRNSLQQRENLQLPLLIPLPCFICYAKISGLLNKKRNHPAMSMFSFF